MSAVGFAEARDLVVAQSSDIRSNVPGVNRDGNTDPVIFHIVEGLVGYAENGEVKPLVAKSFEVSPDGLTYTFKLRDDVKFHNGNAVTADDVVWNWNRYMAADTKWTCAGDFDGSKTIKVSAVTAVDPTTVTMTIEKPSAVFLGLMARPECGYTGIIAKVCRRRRRLRCSHRYRAVQVGRVEEGRVCPSRKERSLRLACQ